MEKIMLIAFQQASGQRIYSFSESPMTCKDGINIQICKSNICRAIKQIVCSLFQAALYGMQKQIPVLLLYEKAFVSQGGGAWASKSLSHAFKCRFSHYPGMEKQWTRNWLTLKLCFVSHSSEDWGICLTTHGQVRKYLWENAGKGMS